MAPAVEEGGDFRAKVAEEFVDPFTLEVIRMPAMAADGLLYEKAQILAWFALGHRTSPRTGLELPSLELKDPSVQVRNVFALLNGVSAAK